MSGTTDGKLARILVVEDDAFLAFDLVEWLSRAGFTVVGPASSLAEAMPLLSRLAATRQCSTCTSAGARPRSRWPLN